MLQHFAPSPELTATVHTGLLLLDVDGPLNPYAAKPHRRPPGCATFRRSPHGTWWTGRDARRRPELRVWLHPEHGAALVDLAAATGLGLTWCTTWLHEANTSIGPSIGLPTLPVLDFDPGDLTPDEHGGRAWNRGGRWKFAAVADYAAGRPLAWLDDEHDDRNFASARAAFDRDRAGTPTLLCHVDPATGLRPEHLERVRTWATGL